MSLIQNISNAETDALALSSFLNDNAQATVPRRIAGNINTLQYYIDYFNALKSLVANPNGTVTINGATMKTIAQSVKDALDTAGVKNGVADVLVAVNNSGMTGAIPRTQADKNADFISVKDFGAKGDFTTDDTQAINNALTAAETTGKVLYFPAGIYRLTKSIVRNAASTWQGELCREKGVGGGEKMAGTWLYFDHNDIGVKFTGKTGYFVGVNINGFGVRRNQVGVDSNTKTWEAQNADYDFYCEGMVSVTISDMLFLCSTKGIYAGGNTANNLGTGRINLYRINGQFFKNAITIDFCYDTVRIDQLHVWPFWIAHDLINKYTQENLDVIHLLRCDNPMLSNIFSIFAGSGIHIGNGDVGGTSKLHLVNADFDRGRRGIWLDTTSDNTTAHINNYTSQGEYADSIGIFIQGNNSQIQCGNVYIADTAANAVRLEGSNNRIDFSSLKIANYDLANVGFSALEALTGNRIDIATLPNITSATGKTNKYGLTGTVVVDDWRDFTPVVNAGSGTLTTVNATGSYKITGSTVTVRFDIKTTTNGTGANDIRLNLPFGTSIDNSVGSGREIATRGLALCCTAQAGVNYILINTFDNKYPAGDGARLVGEIKYRIATI